MQHKRVKPVTSVSQAYSENQMRALIIQYWLPNQRNKIVRNPEFLAQVEKCAAKKPAIKYGNEPFDPKKISRVMIDGKKYPEAYQLILALSHVDAKGKEELLSRVNEPLVGKFESVERLVNFIDSCAIGVTAKPMEETMAITLVDYNGKSVSYTPDDLAKAENKAVVEELLLFLEDRQKVLTADNSLFMKLAYS